MFTLKDYFLNFKGLSDGTVVSLTKKEYNYAVQFLQIFIKSIKSKSNEWFRAIF